jgi:hypothetical protein
MHTTKLRVRSLQRRKKASLRPLEYLKFFQVQEESIKSLRSTAAVGWADRFWIIENFYIQEMHRRSAREK